MSRKLIGLILLLASPLWLLAAALLIKKSVFPFHSVKVMGAGQFAASSPEFRRIPLPAGFEEWVRQEAPGAVVSLEEGNVLEAARELAKFTRREFRHGNDVVLSTPLEPKKSEEQLAALCSEYSKFFVAAAQSIGLEGRVLWMNDHTCAELFDPKTGRPFLADADGNVVFLAENGEPGSIVDVIGTYVTRGPEVYFPRNLVEEAVGGDDPDFLAADRADLYSRQELVLEVEGTRLFEFHERNRSPGAIVSALVGGDGVADARQLYIGSETTPAGRGPFYFWAGMAGLAIHVCAGLCLFRSRASSKLGDSKLDHAP